MHVLNKKVFCCMLAMSNIAQLIFLCSNVGPDRSRQSYRLFSCENMFVDCGHCIGNFLVQCWKSQIREDFIGYFPTKILLCALGHHFTSHFIVQCCLRRI